MKKINKSSDAYSNNNVAKAINWLLIKNRLIIIELLCKNLKDFHRTMDGFMFVQNGNITLSIKLSGNPELTKKFDEKIYFIFMITINNNTLIYNIYRYPEYIFYTTDHNTLVNSRLHEGYYDEILEKLLKKAYFDLKNYIFSDFSFMEVGKIPLL